MSWAIPPTAASYCSLGLACTLANDPATAPWGGLPKPTVLVARLTCDCIQHVFSQWAEALGTDFFPMEAPAWEHKHAGLVPAFANERWEEVYQPDRIALLVAEMRELIALLERKTGRRFDHANASMHADGAHQRAGRLHRRGRRSSSARARPCPVSIADQMPNTMIPQWHRGSDWAVAHARRFRDEVAARVRAGVGVAATSACG